MNTDIPAPVGAPPAQKGQAASVADDDGALHNNGKFVPITLEDPIRLGDTVIDKVTLRKPMAGELRGLSLGDLIEADISTLLRLIPRISSPVVTEDLIAAQLTPIDLGQMGGAVRGFFMTREQQEIRDRMIEESSSRN